VLFHPFVDVDDSYFFFSQVKLGDKYWIRLLGVGNFVNQSLPAPYDRIPVQLVLYRKGHRMYQKRISKCNICCLCVVQLSCSPLFAHLASIRILPFQPTVSTYQKSGTYNDTFMLVMHALPPLVTAITSLPSNHSQHARFNAPGKVLPSLFLCS
jgi:hypothetical protein